MTSTAGSTATIRHILWARASHTQGGPGNQLERVRKRGGGGGRAGSRAVLKMGIFKRLRQKRRARRAAACDSAGHGASGGVRGAVRRVRTSTRRLRRHRRDSSARTARTDRPGDLAKREDLLIQIGVFHRTVDSQRQTIGCFRRALDAQRSTIRALESHTKANARCDRPSTQTHLLVPYFEGCVCHRTITANDATINALRRSLELQAETIALKNHEVRALRSLIGHVHVGGG